MSRHGHLMRAAAGVETGPADPYWGNRSLVMNFDDLTDAKGHPMTSFLVAPDGISGGDLVKSATQYSYVSPTNWSEDFNLVAGSSYAIELEATFQPNDVGFYPAVAIAGSVDGWSTSGYQYYLGRYQGNLVLDFWNGSGLDSTRMRAGAITAGTKTMLTIACDGTRLSAYVGTSRVASITTSLPAVPANGLSRLHIGGAFGPQLTNGSRIHRLRLTKGSTGGIDPASTSLTIPTDPFPTHG